MTKCDKLAELLAEFEAEGNTAAADAIRAAMAASGCLPQTDGGGNGGGR